MTVESIARFGKQTFVGLPSDTKPADAPLGSIFIESESGARYISTRAENLISNGDFETDITGWFAGYEFAIDNWYTPVRTTDEHRFGIASMKVVCPGVAQAEQVNTNISNVTPGTNYVLSFWVKASVGLNMRGILTDFGSNAQVLFTGDGTWHYYTVAQTNKSGDSIARIFIGTTTGAPQAGTFYLDRVQLEHAAIASGGWQDIGRK